MIRGSAARLIVRPCHFDCYADAISRLASLRCFNSFSQQYPYYDDPEARYQAEPAPRHYADRFGYQSGHDVGPGVNMRDSRLGHQFNAYVRPDRYCRCCGRPFWGFYAPASYGVGCYRAVRVTDIHANGYPMNTDYTRHYYGTGFKETDGRIFGHQDTRNTHAGNSRYFPRNSNGQRQEKMSEEHNITNHTSHYWELQDGRERDCGAWSHSTSNYNQYGSEQSFYGERNDSNKLNGYDHQNNGHNGNQTRLAYSKRSSNGQLEGSSVNGQLTKSDGANGQFHQSRQSPWISDVMGSPHGSQEQIQNFNLQTTSNYNQDGIWGNRVHQNFIRPNSENLNAFQRTSSMSHGQNLNTHQNSEQCHKRSNSNNIGEAGSILQDNLVGKRDNANICYQQSMDGSNMNNLYSLRPDFAANSRPLKQNVTNAENNQVADNADSRNDYTVSHGSNKAVGRCQRIIDVLETEGKHGSRGPSNRCFSVKK